MIPPGPPAADKPKRKRPKVEIKINYDWCKRCGICTAFCPEAVFTEDPFGKPLITNPDACIDCQLCVIRCPDFAIDVDRLKEETGP